MIHASLVALAMLGQCYNTPYGRVCPRRAAVVPVFVPQSVAPTPGVVSYPVLPVAAPTPVVYPAMAPYGHQWVWDGYRWVYQASALYPTP